MSQLGDSHWPDIGVSPTVLVPVGSTEQHGPHLPLDTDSTIATAVAESAASRASGDLIVAPAIEYGASGEHQGFPGTISIGRDALHLILVELTRSLSNWANRVIFVNAHGGNASTVDSAVTQLVAEAHNVSWISCASVASDAHAGLTETSLMLLLRPEAVRLERAVRGNVTPIGELLPSLVSGGIRPLSESGVLGDPTDASSDIGRQLFEEMVTRVVNHIGQGS